MLPFRSKLFAFAAALAALVACAGGAEAGWVTFKNDTNKAITVQEFVVINGKKISGKPTKLLAGESFREFQNTPGFKTYEILDAGTPPQSLANARLDCRADMQSFSVVTVNGRTGVIPVQEPKKN